MSTPEMGKHPPDRRDNRPMTWPLFLALRAWAQDVATAEHATVCIVGSALYRFPPRDVDVSIILPRAEFERRFGPLPETSDPEAHRELWAATEKAKAAGLHEIKAQEAVEWAVRVDVKFAPDCWWPDGERLVLADGRQP